MRAAHAAVLGEANASVREELARFDLADGLLDQLAKLPMLLFTDRGVQVLNLRHTLADEHHQSHVCDAADPGVADQLRVQGKQPFRYRGVAAGGGFPLQQAASAV